MAGRVYSRGEENNENRTEQNSDKLTPTPDASGHIGPTSDNTGHMLTLPLSLFFVLVHSSSTSHPLLLASCLPLSLHPFLPRAQANPQILAENKKREEAGAVSAAAVAAKDPAPSKIIPSL